MSQYTQDFFITKRVDLLKVAKFIMQAVINLPREKRWHVVIQPLYNMRSVKQNRYYFGVVLKTIADWYESTRGVKVSVDALHEEFKPLYCPYVIETDSTGNEIKISVSTTKLKTYEFNDMFEEIIADFAQMGCYIPEPDADWKKNERRPKEDIAA